MDSGSRQMGVFLSLSVDLDLDQGCAHWLGCPLSAAVLALRHCTRAHRSLGLLPDKPRRTSLRASNLWPLSSRCSPPIPCSTLALPRSDVRSGAPSLSASSSLFRLSLRPLPVTSPHVRVPCEHLNGNFCNASSPCPTSLRVLKRPAIHPAGVQVLHVRYADTIVAG